MQRLQNKDELAGLQKKLKAARESTERYISVCTGTGCLANGAGEVLNALKNEIAAAGLNVEVKSHGAGLIRGTGCHGFCGQGPLVVVFPEKIFYQRVKPRDAASIVKKTLINGEVAQRLLYKAPKAKETILHENDIPYYKGQKRLLMSANGHVDPKSIDDYIAIGGYEAMANALTTMQPAGIIKEVMDAGLRGRGGAGFPTGRKWEDAAKQDAKTKYLICNADEGDPGAYMDRSLLEGNPHSVIEGMIIGAFAVGATKGYIYVRKEYPLALENADKAIEDATAMGLLGDSILGTDFSFSIEVARGGGAFVAGESSALMASIMGRPAEPRTKYIHATQSGLYNKPTVLNNVETWANVPLIIKNGAKWYAGIGTETSKGTKIFSLVGDVKDTGLVEVPMGTTLREVIFDIGGGIADDREFKAVQTGGPSGGVLPASILDMPIDFESLADAGSMMGSGGMIVMDDHTCMVDIARYYIEFLAGESCGKCTPCREGLRQMLDILTRITQGQATMDDLDLLEELAVVVKEASLCGLGQTAPNPVISTIKYFRGEYEAHILEKRCPAGVCTSLIHFEVIPDACTGCYLCKVRCPVEAIEGKPKEIHKIDQEKCIKCGVCMDVCRYDAIKVE